MWKQTARRQAPSRRPSAPLRQAGRLLLVFLLLAALIVSAGWIILARARGH